MNTNCKIFTNNIEEKALRQIKALQENPLYKDAILRFMPDVHAGCGCTIGTTICIPYENIEEVKISPALIGNDIGCGIRATRVGQLKDNLKLEEVIDFEKLDTYIRNIIPSGNRLQENPKMVIDFFNSFKMSFTEEEKLRMSKSFGTLGGGNHFIELDIDEYSNLWILVHTGSRSLGAYVYNHYMNIAKGINDQKNASESQIQEINKSITNFIIENLKDTEGKILINTLLNQRQDLIQSIRKILNVEYHDNDEGISNLYLTEHHLVDYLHDVKSALCFASENRRNILNTVYLALFEFVPNLHEIFDGDIQSPKICIDTPHNYIDNNKVSKTITIRKGAIRASKKQNVIIPLNMRDGAIIGIGKGNTDWNDSAPHGAGRVMSRTKAKENIILEDFEETMKGVFSNSICDNTIDESPFAYKPMEEILENIQGNIEIKNIIRPIYNFKAID